MNLVVIEWNFIYINLYLLLTISALLGLWGFSQRESMYRNIFPFAPYGAYFFLCLGAICFATTGNLLSNANDPALKIIRDGIIFSHTRLRCHLSYLPILQLYFDAGAKSPGIQSSLCSHANALFHLQVRRAHCHVGVCILCDGGRSMFTTALLAFIISQVICTRCWITTPMQSPITIRAMRKVFKTIAQTMRWQRWKHRAIILMMRIIAMNSRTGKDRRLILLRTPETFIYGKIKMQKRYPGISML